MPTERFSRAFALAFPTSRRPYSNALIAAAGHRYATLSEWTSWKLLQEKYAALRAGMNEAMRRRWAAVEARALGYGGAKQVAEATGLSLPTIRRGGQSA